MLDQEGRMTNAFEAFSAKEHPEVNKVEVADAIKDVLIQMVVH